MWEAKNESEPPNSSCLQCSRGGGGEGRPFQKVVGNASPDTPSHLQQKKLKLAKPGPPWRAQGLSSCGPVTQPAPIFRSLCRKENEFLSVVQEREYVELNQRDFLEVVTQLHG